MYEKDKSQRITLRLNQTQFDFVKSNADLLGVSPSDFLRMVINATLATTTACVNQFETNPAVKDAVVSEAKEFLTNVEGEVERRENEQTDKHDIV